MRFRCTGGEEVDIDRSVWSQWPCVEYMNRNHAEHVLTDGTRVQVPEAQWAVIPIPTDGATLRQLAVLTRTMDPLVGDELSRAHKMRLKHIDRELVLTCYLLATFMLDEKMEGILGRHLVREEGEEGDGSITSLVSRILPSDYPAPKPAATV